VPIFLASFFFVERFHPHRAHVRDSAPAP
jgi:hypothetical protein